MPKTNPLKEALRDSAPPKPMLGRRPKDTSARGSRQKLIGARFEEGVHRQLRVWCATEGIALRDGLREALNDYFVKHDLPPIA